MPIGQLVLTVACVLIISLGQVLFKYVGLNMKSASSVFEPRILGMIAGALFVYAVATLLWILLLRSVPLSRAYPFMAMAFLVVPALSYFFFNEPINGWYLVGTALIIGGVVVITVNG